MRLAASIEEPSPQSGPGTDAGPTGLAAPTVEGLYKQAVLTCLAANNTSWVENAFMAEEYPNEHEAANALRHLVSRHLLKEVGDAKTAASILEALTFALGIPEDANQKFFRLLSRYTA